MVPESRLKVGGVSYLNTRPLIEGISDDDPLIDLRLDVPSGLAIGLANGQYDIALIPIIEYFRGRDYSILPCMAIASHGTVKSVCLFSKVPIPEITSVGLDTSSRTSRALVQILLDEQYGIHPEYVQSSSDTDPRQAATDATLLIGDPALRLDRCGLHVLDLGSGWHQLTGLPFVYACWVARTRDVSPQFLAAYERLLCAKEDGKRNVVTIASRAAREMGLHQQDCLDYLTQHIQHDLGEAEITGMQLFHRYAVKHQLAPEDTPVLLWNV